MVPVKFTAALRVVVLGNLLWLSACATQPRMIEMACLAPEDARVAGQFALEVEQKGASYQLLVVTQWRGGQLTFAGFNAVGAKLFTGQMEGEQIVAESSRLYRGPAANDLLWGLLMHRLRGQLPDCWPSTSVQVDSLARPTDKEIHLRRGGKRIFSSLDETGFVLPPQAITVQVRPLL